VDEALGRVDVPLKELIRGAARARALTPRAGVRVGSRGLARSRSAGLRARTPGRRPTAGSAGASPGSSARAVSATPSPQKPSRERAYPGPGAGAGPGRHHHNPALARAAPRLTAALDAAVACVSPFAAAAPAGGAAPAPASLMHASSRPLSPVSLASARSRTVNGNGAASWGGGGGEEEDSEDSEEEDDEGEAEEEEEADSGDALAGGGWILPQLADGLARLGSTDVCVPSHQDHKTGARPRRSLPCWVAAARREQAQRSTDACSRMGSRPRFLECSLGCRSGFAEGCAGQ